MIGLRELKYVILAQAAKIPGGYIAQEKAPDSLPGIIQNYSETGRITVWSGESEKTVYEDRLVNFAFRAWHDYYHLLTEQDFTLEGERIVCNRQIKDARLPEYMVNILECDCLAQVEFYYRTGAFPVDQKSFMLDYLKQRSEK